MCGRELSGPVVMCGGGGLNKNRLVTQTAKAIVSKPRAE